MQQWAGYSLGFLSRPYWRETRAAFVLSTGRTGTKTLARLLDLSPEIDAFHEPHPQLLQERKAARWDVHRNERAYEQIFTLSRGAMLFRSHFRNRIYAETSARLTFFAPVIKKLLPESRFFFIHRDPRAVIRSGMRRGWYVDHPADFARVRPVPGEAAWEEWESWSPFEKICLYWDSHNRFSLDFYEDDGASQVLSIRADDLFTGAAVSDIFAHLDVPSPSPGNVERVLSKKLNAQKQDEFPKAPNWSTDMIETLHRMAGDTMERLGYKEQPTTNQEHV